MPGKELNYLKKNSRLQFTEEERASPELKKPIQKAEKAADRVEQVKKKARLQFESDAPKPPSKLSHEVKKAPGRLLSEEVHRNIRESEDENVGIQAAHGTEQAAETALHMGESAYHAHKLKPQRELYKEEQKLDQANVDALYKQSLRNDPQGGSNPMSRYAKNPDKTADGEFISAYECDPATVDAEFLAAKRIYADRTGRSQQSDVIAYQVRQSFRPGEITSEEANKIGYEFAMRLTKGKHAFIVATHVDKAHIHNHIIYNSTTLCFAQRRNGGW